MYSNRKKSNGIKPQSCSNRRNQTAQSLKLYSAYETIAQFLGEKYKNALLYLIKLETYRPMK